jgi:DNA-binding XRE family transcriptional regulator
MDKNWNRAAMRFASVGYLSRQRMLAVTFENGDHFIVATESILPVSNNGKSSRPGAAGHPDWSKMRVGEMGDVLEVPASGDMIEIPWDRIRSVADPDFRAHLADRAAERATKIGARIRAMRIEAGLTRDKLAEKVGITRVLIADLEAGNIEPTTDLIENIAMALGKRLGDFAEVSRPSAGRGRRQPNRTGKRLLRVPTE